jgi:hypothetical protein
MSASQPQAGQIISREIVFEAYVQGLTPMLKVATVSRPGADDYYTFACDEGPAIGGQGSAPTPLAYFSAAIAF